MMPTMDLTPEVLASLERMMHVAMTNPQTGGLNIRDDLLRLWGALAQAQQRADLAKLQADE